MSLIPPPDVPPNGSEPDDDRPAVELVLTIEEAARCLRIGRTLMYALVTSGEVESICIGRLRRVPVDALTAYLERLRAGAAGSEVA